jgi:predicted O-linked N-acetylglucosamine transferase (SPINDLY family)
VNYLGFPGTLGAPYIDYILADDFVIPADARQHYAEKVVWLPGCFQVNDSERIRSSEAGAAPRGQHGLPESGVVFCCFNNTYKINPQSFDSWMRILQAVPGSVLWMLADEEAARANLRREALQRGVEPERLVFAKRASYAEHLARLPCADLFLDTLPFNAGTTASDALWSGVPVLTCCGEALAARMAGSLLRAMNLPELITYNMQDYEAAAIRLGGTPGLLAEIRARVDEQRGTSTVFDTEHFRRNVEQAYVSMWERLEQGQPPESFACSL